MFRAWPICAAPSNAPFSGRADFEVGPLATGPGGQYRVSPMREATREVAGVRHEWVRRKGIPLPIQQGNRFAKWGAERSLVP
jgi:hypothetical protein